MHDKARALEPIEFVQLLKHSGDFYGQPFVLLDWQHDVLWDVYGTVRDDGLRQYRAAYLEIPKKNGKTELIAALALYHLACDPAGGEIYCCAADKQQAGIVYKAACAMVEQEPAFADRITTPDGSRKKHIEVKSGYKEIRNNKTGSYLRVLSAEAYTKHGINPSVVIFDELHAQPNRDLWDVMTFGASSARREPLLWVITTAGDDPDRASIGWEVHEQARKVQDGELVDPTMYVKIYAAPEDADIYDEAVWHAANPSLGHTMSVDTLRQEALRARNSEATEKLFRWLRLNQWVSLKRLGWLPLTLYDQRRSKLTPADLVGKRCYCGLDLSSTTDLTALGFVFPPQDGLDKYVLMTRQWIPADGMAERVRRDKVPYDKWAKAGHVEVTPGSVIDYELIMYQLAAVSLQYDVVAWGNDPWGAEKLRQDLERGVEVDGKEAVIELAAIRQNIENLSPAMKEIERLLGNGEAEIVHNPATRWAFGNVTVVEDGNGNYKAKKISAVQRIDPMAALFNAMVLCLRMEPHYAPELADILAI